jgi:LAGLIDADG endonuclease
VHLGPAPQVSDDLSAVGYLLETPSISRYRCQQRTLKCAVSSGNNPSSADNQQERPGIDEQWIVGFVDGEGCFSVPFFRNKTYRLGWQVQPVFAVVQGARSVDVLHRLKEFFGCGGVYINERHDNHKEHPYRYDVRALRDLSERIIPFFEANPLQTAKDLEFKKFVQIIELMTSGRHRSLDGLTEIAQIVQTMNHRKPSRFLESSEAIRQPTLLDVKS